MQAFENDLMRMVKNIKFMKHLDNFQKIIMTLKEFTTQINIYIYRQNNQHIFYKFHKVQKPDNKQHNTYIHTKKHLKS